MIRACKMKQRIIQWATGLSLLYVGFVAAATLPEQLLANKLNALKSMQANFSQTITAKQRVVARSRGFMAFMRPGKFRWQTNEPLQQQVIADGKRVWIYDVALEQVTAKSQAQTLNQGAVGLFLSGRVESVVHDFKVSLESKGNTQRFDLRAISGKSNFRRIQMVFTGDQLTAFVFFDALSQKTEVHLSQNRVNVPLNPGLFTFKLPKGVDVVQG